MCATVSFYRSPRLTDPGQPTPLPSIADLEETASSSGEESPGGVPVGAALVTQPLEEMTVKQLKLLAKASGLGMQLEGCGWELVGAGMAGA